MKKTLILLLSIIFVFTLFGVAASAEYTDGEEAEANIFETVYTEALKHSDKILSALAFSASLILAVVYKKGLLPLIKGALSALTSSVDSLKEETESASLAAKRSIEDSSARLESSQMLLESLTGRLEAIENELSAKAEEQNMRRDIKRIMSAQVDMLYEIFMSSSLPAYQKESVGEKISEMKKSLTLSDGESQ